MMVVDTSVWIGYFHDRTHPLVNHLQEALRERKAITLIPIVLTEVLQGLRDEKNFSTVCTQLTRLPMLSSSIDTYIRAADLYRSLRRNGITIRGTIDCIIAQYCIDANASLLSLDRDFTHIAASTSLQLITY